MKTFLERMETLLGGPIVAFDGRYLVWFKVAHPNMAQSTVDLRDVVPRIKGATLVSLREAIPVFEKPKRAKVAVTEEGEE